ncbi:MAG: helix-turn-helix transcriptional regulator [Clostridia bacterium]|nr:helix-turn-helix transcriptional regulator [Clostridia bacterium]
MRSMTLGLKIRELRMSRQLTQKELAGDFITRNMLSQIENDQANPSISTLEYLAKQLRKPVGYFLDDDSETYFINIDQMQILEAYEKKDYRQCIAIEEKKDISELRRNEAIAFCVGKSYYFLARESYLKGLYPDAFHFIDKAITYLENTDIEKSKVYLLAGEIGYYLNDSEKINDFIRKSEYQVNNSSNNNMLLHMYNDLMNKRYDEILKKVIPEEKITLDELSEAKYQMIIGLSYYYLKKPKQAIEHLLLSVNYYINHEENAMAQYIYEKLSKCYSMLNEYKDAYEYLTKSKENIE